MTTHFNIKSSILLHKASIFIVGLLFSTVTFVYAQSNCEVSQNYVFSTKNKSINWQITPTFSLPFKLIYGGPRFTESTNEILSHGFTHLNSLGNNDRNLPKENRAIIFYGVANEGNNQPWQLFKSPWNNTISSYENYWKNAHKRFTELFVDSQTENKIKADIFVFDIERQIKSNDSILLLKNNATIPIDIKNLDNQLFITKYKKDLQLFYTLPFAYFNQFGMDVPFICSYADTPIFNTFANIQANTWQNWTTNAHNLNFLNYNFSTNSLGGELYNSQTFLMPSAYYYFDYSSPFGSDYLVYLLFQIEANRAWSTKPIIPIVWLKYSQNLALRNTFIKPWMIEATAIFPFFSGANGLWLWEDPTTFTSDLNYEPYERFITSLYRLSQFKDMFMGDYQLVIPKTAYELYVNRQPIVRAVKKNNYVLVAAQNPYAKSETEVVETSIQVGNWSSIITLTGYEVFLCKFDLNLLANENNLKQNFTVYPNPFFDKLTVNFESLTNETLQIQLISDNGKLISESNWEVTIGQNQKNIEVEKCNSKSMQLIVKAEDKIYFKKIITN